MHRRKDNINMNIQEEGKGDMDWMHLAWDRGR